MSTGPLDRLRDEAVRLGALCGAPEELCRLPASRTDDGAPHLEFADGVYRHIVTERGLTLDVLESRDPEEILYRILRDATFAMAVGHELRNRRDDIDGRRIIFPHQLMLMDKIRADWHDRCAGEIDAILRQHSYRDPASAPAQPSDQPC